jgi:hypothetical protein
MKKNPILMVSQVFLTSIYNQIKKNILIKNYDYQNFKFSINEEIFLNFIKNTYLYSDNDLIIDKSLREFFLYRFNIKRFFLKLNLFIHLEIGLIML